MSDRYFIDTNILIYTFDEDDPEKQETAQKIVRHATGTGFGYLSFQVVQECLNVLVRQFSDHMTLAQRHYYMQNTLQTLCKVFASFPLYDRALDLQSRWGFGFYDSLIIAAALETDADKLYSEDLQHGQIIEKLEIVNPFLDHRRVHEEKALYLPEP